MKTKKEKTQTLTSSHLALLTMEKSERRQLMNWMKVVDALEKKTPPEKIQFPLNDPYALKGLVVKNPEGIENASVNWLMSSDNNSKISFLEAYLFDSVKTKSWWTKSPAGQKSHEKNCAALLKKLTDKKVIQPLDQVCSEINEPQKTISVLALAVAADHELARPLYLACKKSLTNDHLFEIVRAAVKSETFGLQDGYGRHAWDLFRKTDHIVFEALNALDFENETDPKRSVQALLAAAQVGLSKRMRDEEKTKNSADEQPKDTTDPLEQFKKNFAKLNDDVLMGVVKMSVAHSWRVSNLFLGLSSFLSESQREKVVEAWVETFSDAPLKNVLLHDERSPSVALFPVTDPRYTVTDEQAKKWFEALGVNVGFVKDPERLHIYGASCFFGSRYLHNAIENKDKMVCFSPRALLYIQNSLDEVFHAIKEKKDEEMAERNKPYSSIRRTETPEEIQQKKSKNEKQTLLFNYMFSQKSFQDFLDNKPSPAKKML